MKTIVIRPYITEKTLTLAAKGWYTFVVNNASTKQQIGDEVATLYRVTVRDVRTSSVAGKERRSGRKMIKARTSDWKKALVRLPAGQTISAFEVTKEEGKK